MANTNTGNQQKKVYDSTSLRDTAMDAYNSIDEQAILNKYNQATAAQFAAQQDQNRIAENNFYNQMYNTQRTAMDTIRQSNANAVSTGASRGVQAANELSALLGLQQESIASATEIANARRQTAQEETAAMLQNIVQASQDAAAQRQQALQSAIQAQSLVTDQDAAATANLGAIQDATKTSLDENNPAYILNAAAETGKLAEYANHPSTAGLSFLDTTLNTLGTPNWQTYEAMNTSGSTDAAHNMLRSDAQYLTQIARELGVYDEELEIAINTWLNSALYRTDLTTTNRGIYLDPKGNYASLAQTFEHARDFNGTRVSKESSWLDKINVTNTELSALKNKIRAKYQAKIK